MKAEKQIIIAVVFLALAFCVNRLIYSDQRISARDCAGGKCLDILMTKPELGPGNSSYYLDNFFKDKAAGFYRLTFRDKAEAAEIINIRIITSDGQENFVGELDLKPGNKFHDQEILLYFPGKYENLLFEKNDPQSAGNIYLDDIGITRLNIEKNAQAQKLRRTIFGETGADNLIESQAVATDAYAQLKNKKTEIGQVFQAAGGMIYGVSLSADINKSFNPGSRQYELSLKKVRKNGDKFIPEGDEIATLGFSAKSIEEYRKQDGTFLFPLFGFLEQGEQYLISLDNSKVEIDKQDFLELNGSRQKNSYPNGTAVIKKGKEFFPLDGDLYFAIHGPQYLLENGQRLLNGAKIEDLGKGFGKYSYGTKGESIDLLDLAEASAGTEFDTDMKTIVVPAQDEADLIYEVNTVYPIEKLNFSATQLKAGWKKVSIAYSFDRENWTDLPYSQIKDGSIDANVPDENQSANEGNGNSDAIIKDNPSVSPGGSVQSFNYDIIPGTAKTEKIFFRITYDKNDKSKSRNFSIKNLKITADLRIDEK